MGLTHGRKRLIIIRQAFLEAETLIVQLPAPLRAERGEFRLFVLKL
jgi:hypothetical protein